MLVQESSGNTRRGVSPSLHPLTSCISVIVVIWCHQIYYSGLDSESKTKRRTKVDHGEEDEENDEHDFFAASSHGLLPITFSFRSSLTSQICRCNLPMTAHPDLLLLVLWYYVQNNQTQNICTPFLLWSFSHSSVWMMIIRRRKEEEGEEERVIYAIKFCAVAFGIIQQQHIHSSCESAS